MTRLIAIGVAAVVSVALLWVSPLVGLISVAAFMAAVPPWGKTLAERAVISGIVLLGLVAVVFPRAGSTPVDAVTARGVLAGLVIAAAALYLVPALRKTPIPKPRLTDLVLLAIGGGLFFWLISLRFLTLSTFWLFAFFTRGSSVLLLFLWFLTFLGRSLNLNFDVFDNFIHHFSVVDGLELF